MYAAFLLGCITLVCYMCEQLVPGLVSAALASLCLAEGASQWQRRKTE